MAEGKYGRLFTEEDVVRIVQHAAHLYRGEPASEESARETLGVILDYQDGYHEAKPGEGELLRFPKDEPLFLLRGRDRFAEDGYVGYINAIGTDKVPDAHWRAAREAHIALVEWQRENPDRVKVPD